MWMSVAVDLLLGILVIACYYPSLKAPLLFDDKLTLYRNPGTLAGNIVACLMVPIYWRQLLSLTFAMDIRRGGGLAGGLKCLHQTNILIHAISACGAYGVLRSLGFDLLPATLGATGFVVHPIAVGAVTNISGRSASLSGMFWVFSIWAILSGQYIVAWSLASLAFFSKEDTVTLVVVLPLTASIVRYDHSQWLSAFAILLSTITWRWRSMLAIYRENGAKELAKSGYRPLLGPVPYMLTAFTALVLGYPKWAVGVGIELDPDPPVVRDDFNLRVLAASSICWALVVMAIFGGPITRVVLAWIVLGPMCLYPFIPMMDPVGVHRSYYSILGLSVIVATIATLSAPLAAALTYWWTLRRSWEQYLWIDPLRFWEEAVKQSPAKERPYLNLGVAYFEGGAMTKAAETWNAVLRIHPKFSAVKANLAAVAIGLDQLDRAKILLNEAIRDHPFCDTAWENFGVIAEKEERSDDAEANYLQALACDSASAPVLNRLGNLAYKRKRIPEALQYFQRAFTLRPDQHWYGYNAAIAMVSLARYEEAFTIVRKLPIEALKQFERYAVTAVEPVLT